MIFAVVILSLWAVLASVTLYLQGRFNSAMKDWATTVTGQIVWLTVKVVDPTFPPPDPLTRVG